MKAIPEIEDPKVYSASDFSNSRFVEILSGGRIGVKMMYPSLGFSNAEEHCYVREEVYHILLEAAEKLPEGYSFLIWDAWRPFALQKELYLKYSENIISEFGLNDFSTEEKKAVIRKYVSDPVEDKNIPPVHTTGGAVDLTIIGPDGTELDMGCGFDEFTDKSMTAFFEERDETQIKDNRRLLYNIMTEAGFTNLPSEWWHYDYGDRFYGYYTKKPAIYDGVFARRDMKLRDQIG